MSALRIGVIFGGRSVEHEISVLTAQQVMAALPIDRYTAVPIYISKAGQWFTGEALRTLDNFKDLELLVGLAEPVLFNVDATQPGLQVRAMPQRRGWLGGGRSATPRPLAPLDVAFPVVHGSHGEDGTLQGLLEMADLPYVGAGVAASAVGMDKALTKVVLRGAGLPVLDDVQVSRTQWERDPEGGVATVEARFAYPVFVKPISLGSSIGVASAEGAAALRTALEVALTYDDRVLIEPAQQEIIEVNCAVLGRGAETQASVCEQPLAAGVLSYEDKYIKGGKAQGMKGARRLIPAPLDATLTAAIQSAAQHAFAAIGAEGVARVDFLVQKDGRSFVVNEINTMPGSLAFYLWEPVGLAFPQLISRLIELAQERYREKRRRVYTFSSSVLAMHAK